MSETKTHLGQAIDIINSIFEPYSEIYNGVVKQLFDSYRIPKLDPSLCSVDNFIKAALEGKPIEIKYINRGGMPLSQTIKDKPIKIKFVFNNFFDYQKDLSFSDNLKKQFCIVDPIDSITWTDIGDNDLKNRLVQRIIQEKEAINRLNFVFLQKEYDFYYHINKSLLNAEYLFIEDYSKQLEDAVKNIEKTETILDVKKPRFVRDFFILASKMTELCERIRNAIGDRNNRRIEIEDHAEENADRIASKLNVNNNPTTNSDKHLRFTLSVIEMTSIDHIYKASSDNIGKLLTLWERIKDVNGSSGNFKKVVDMVTGKTATLIYKMVFDNGDEKSLQYLNIDNFDFFFKDSEKIKEEIEKSKLTNQLNKTIDYKVKNKNKAFTKEDLDNNNQKLDLSIANVPDMVKYNNWVARGQEHYIDMSSTIAAIEQGTQSNNYKQVIGKIEGFLQGKKLETKQSCEDIERFSPFFFISSICFVNNQLDNQLKIETVDFDNLSKLLNLMNKLLLYMEHYIRTYTNSMPTVFRPYFEHSFYQYNTRDYTVNSLGLDINKITNYDCKIFENSFFFASYYCNATNFGRLHDFYERYLLQFQSFSYELSHNILEKEAGTIKKDLETAKKEFTDAIEIQKEDIKSTQRSSLQTLGLFTAFLSFIVSTIGTFRVVGNLTEYIIYSLTFTLAVVLFAFLISDHNSKLYSEKDEPFGFFTCLKYIVYVIVLSLLFLLSIYYYSNENFSYTKEETKGALSITIDNSSTPNSTVNLNDIAPNETDTSNNATKPQ